MSRNSSAGKSGLPWKILIADDDEDVHTATKLALREVVFRGRGIEFVDAYSARETLLRLQEHPDVAVVFLDVIMESDDAGLSAVQQIRAEGFSLVRLILRTGHPGQAPEREVIVDYDIHDYKEKSGLTTQKLFSSLISALRAYDDLVALEGHRRGLMSVLESVSWFDFGAVQRYVDGMLVEFSSLARLNAEQVVIAARMTDPGLGDRIRVVASSGDWVLAQDSALPMDGLPASAARKILESIELGESLETEDGCTLYVYSHGTDLVAYAAGPEAFAGADRVLLEVFLVKVCQAVANYRAFQGICAERDGLFLGLSRAAEQCHGGSDTLAVLTKLTQALTQRLDTTLVFPELIDADFKLNIGISSGLHDLGNLALPPGLLEQGRSLNETELERMRTHVAAGLKLLQPSLDHAPASGAIALAGQIIAGHHEHFDGTGYPCGLAGEDIPLAARIIAVADAYVAMTSVRPYRGALSRQQAMEQIVAGSGREFDPRVVEAFLQVMEYDDL